ncbi:hypothetical protein BC938DRAFT_471888 [Jimgerdemannia flammicorona]|uniref:Uncharacterized protein n=1 Tax=Jimgerdemannia flammicorona TaxID=994334 RepID=A0A433QUH9_9FUNG|nr:hypothetical protein BC938DRAFT_471888 [Jimgerdemannia flammicorona]
MTYDSCAELLSPPGRSHRSVESQGISFRQLSGTLTTAGMIRRVAPQNCSVLRTANSSPMRKLAILRVSKSSSMMVGETGWRAFRWQIPPYSGTFDVIVWRSRTYGSGAVDGEDETSWS